MSIFRRAKEASSDLAAASKRHAQHGKLELEVRRLESKVNSEKDAIGQLLVPLLEAGTLQVDLPDVHDHMKTIGELVGEIGERRAKIKALVGSGAGQREDNEKAEGSSEQSAHDDWENEGGHTAGQSGQG